MRLLIITWVIVAAALGYAMYAANGMPTAGAQGYPNTCAGWATMLGKQGKVAGSISMHMLGCDDRGTASYHATGYSPYYPNAYLCNKLARYYARWGYFGMPRTVAAMVVARMPTCFVFEDGTYGST